MNIVTEITSPTEIEEYTDSIQELRDLIYTVVGPRTEKVFTEVRILVILISQPFIRINQNLGYEVMLILKELYYKYLKSEFYDDLTYYTNQIAPIFDDKNYQDNEFIKELKNFIYLRMATTKYISHCLNTEEWDHSLTNILESFQNTKSLFFADLKKNFVSRLTSLMTNLNNLNYSAWQLENLIKANALDKKAQILIQYVPGCLSAGASQGGRGGRGGGGKKRKKKGGRGPAKKGAGAAIDGLEPILTDMKAKIGMGKIASNTFEDVMDLLK